MLVSHIREIIAENPWRNVFFCQFFCQRWWFCPHSRNITTFARMIEMQNWLSDYLTSYLLCRLANCFCKIICLRRQSKDCENILCYFIREKMKIFFVIFLFFRIFQYNVTNAIEQRFIKKCTTFYNNNNNKIFRNL